MVIISAVATFLFDMRIGLFDHPPSEESRRFLTLVDELNIDVQPKLLLFFRFQKLLKTKAYRKWLELYKEIVDNSKTTIDRKMEELATNLENDTNAQSGMMPK